MARMIAEVRQPVNGTATKLLRIDDDGSFFAVDDDDLVMVCLTPDEATRLGNALLIYAQAADEADVEVAS